MNMPRLFLETALSERDVKALMEYVERMVSYAAAPTPEVEPVAAWLNDMGTHQTVAFSKLSGAFEHTALVKAREPGANPAPSELVKAAREASDLLIVIRDGKKGVDWQETELEDKAYAIRAALDKVKS